MPTFDHECISITMPDGWRLDANPPDEVFARFHGADGETVEVILAAKPYDPDGEPASRIIDWMADDYGEVLSRRYQSAVWPDPGPLATVEPTSPFVAITRTYNCGPEWRVFARYAMTTGPFPGPDGSDATAFVSVIFHARVGSNEHVEAAISNARMFPRRTSD